MENKELRSLRILEAVEHNTSISQRSLADKMNISLGLVNSFCKNLAEKGFVKVASLPKNRVKYILTPDGAAEKTRLTYNYIKHSFDLYKTSFRKVNEVMCDLSSKGVKDIVFFGATSIAEIAHVSMLGLNIRPIAVIDDRKVGDLFLGLTIISLKSAENMSFDKVIVAAFDFQEYAIEKLYKIGIDRERIVTFDDGPNEG